MKGKETAYEVEEVESGMEGGRSLPALRSIYALTERKGDHPLTDRERGGIPQCDALGGRVGRRGS